MKIIHDKLVKINKNKYSLFILFIIIFIFWFLFTHITKHEFDDITYQYFTYDSTKRITNIKDIIDSQYYMYFTLSGRAIVNSLTQFFLMYDKVFFDIANSIVFAVTIFLIYSFRKNKENNLLLATFIFLSFWFFCGDLYRSFIWESASFNYGWQVMFSLLFIKPYFVGYDKNKSIDSNVFVCMLYLIYSFFAGWGHEVISPVVILAVFFYLIYKIKNNLNISKFEIIGFTGYCLGTAFLLFAPGNFKRLDVINVLYSQFDIFPFSKYIFALSRNVYFLCYYTMPIMIIMFLVLFYSMKKKYHNNSMVKDYRLKLYYALFLFLFSSLFPFIFMGYASSIIIVPLTIMLIIIERYLDYEYINSHIEYCYIVIILLFVLFVLQGTATIYYCMTKNVHISHEFKLVS